MNYSKIGSKNADKDSIYYNMDRIKYSIKKDKSPMKESNSSSVSRYDESLSGARKRHNNFLSSLINSRLDL